MKNNILVYIAFLFLLPLTTRGQWVSTPGKPQEKAIILKGGTIHLGNGEVLAKADLLFENGLIKAVGTDLTVDSEMEVIDVTGQHVYPGLILPNSRIGLTEISAFRATSDYAEEGEYLPNINTAYAYTVDSEIIPTLRFNGVLVAEVAPSGGVISGVSSVMELDGWNWEAALVQTAGMHLNWPAKKSRRFDRASGAITLEDSKSYLETVSELKSMFNDAINYGQSAEKNRNLKLDAMQPLLNRKMKLFIHCEDAYGIVESVRYFKSLGLDGLVIVTEEAALKVKDFLAEEKVPVVIPPTLSLPGGIDMDYDIRYKLPALLTKAGVKVALSHVGSITESRNLPFYAGVAAAFGLEKEEALKLVTSNTAEILGVEDLMGTLEVGKQATLLISEGDIMEIATNDVVQAFIRGQKTVLKNKQQEMYEKYSEKYTNEKD